MIYGDCLVIVSSAKKCGAKSNPSILALLAESGKFMDWQKYRLGRLQSEMRTEFKKSGFEK